MLPIASGTDDLVVCAYLPIVGAVFPGAKVQTGIDLLFAAHSPPPEFGNALTPPLKANAND